MIDDLKQFKSLTDLSSIIQKIASFKARPIDRGSHPTLYAERKAGRYRTVMGVRVCDYRFNVDFTKVLPDDQMGLSFSSTWQHLEFVYKLMSANRDKPLDVHWLLSKADIPPGLAFVADRARTLSAQGHFFLTVTDEMRVDELVAKLKLVANHMSVIYGASKLL